MSDWPAALREAVASSQHRGECFIIFSWVSSLFLTYCSGSWQESTFFAYKVFSHGIPCHGAVTIIDLVGSFRIYPFDSSSVGPAFCLVVLRITAWTKEPSVFRRVVSGVAGYVIEYWL